METTANSDYIKWKCIFPRDDTNSENMACERANVSNVVLERAKVTSERGQRILIFVPNPRSNTALSNGTMSNANPRNNLVSRLISANLLRNFRLPLEDNASVRGLFIPRKLSTRAKRFVASSCFTNQSKTAVTGKSFVELLDLSMGWAKQDHENCHYRMNERVLSKNYGRVLVIPFSHSSSFLSIFKQRFSNLIDKVYIYLWNCYSGIFSGVLFWNMYVAAIWYIVPMVLWVTITMCYVFTGSSVLLVNLCLLRRKYRMYVSAWW